MFLNDWKETGIDGLKADFAIQESDLTGAEILLASYTHQDCGGSAFVLFRRDGKLYEANGSHCSCYELEGMWEPEETTVEAIRLRIDKDYNFDGMREELRALLPNIK
jgi:hypothetical protein